MSPTRKTYTVALVKTVEVDAVSEGAALGAANAQCADGLRVWRVMGSRPAVPQYEPGPNDEFKR